MFLLAGGLVPWPREQFERLRQRVARRSAGLRAPALAARGDGADPGGRDVQSALRDQGRRAARIRTATSSRPYFWTRGVLTQPMPIIAEVPWPQADLTFTPLGYRPAQDRTGHRAHLFAGLPMLMAVICRSSQAAAPCSGSCRSPCACLCAFTYLLGREARIPGGRCRGAVGCSSPVPIVLYMSVNPMSDMPAAAHGRSTSSLPSGAHSLSARRAGHRDGDRRP